MKNFYANSAEKRFIQNPVHIRQHQKFHLNEIEFFEGEQLNISQAIDLN